ncbi:hypothetical protein M3212_09330 [Alkalihalobacillus oceani]|uniref:hypothetical protein n=1 Tax=Halalkalibacter oceani TaxID=1653776 RepID=UPI00203BA428|nr:hypothetical protein [Halalkalibacter oceani]MCM3760986.1 hypothetical protein [Halalkalibacter oceani]
MCERAFRLFCYAVLKNSTGTVFAIEQKPPFKKNYLQVGGSGFPPFFIDDLVRGFFDLWEKMCQKTCQKSVCSLTKYFKMGGDYFKKEEKNAG